MNPKEPYFSRQTREKGLQVFAVQCKAKSIQLQQGELLTDDGVKFDLFRALNHVDAH